MELLVWSGVVIVALFAVWLLSARDMRLCRKWDRWRTGLCPQCGYDLRASSGNCPECGRPIRWAD